MKKIAIGFLALTLAVVLAAPAMAEGIAPYASMRLGTYWVSHDYKDYADLSGFVRTDDDDDAGLMFDIVMPRYRAPYV